jgi:hypothetical protein
VKESLMKYVGKGLAIPPGKICLDCSALPRSASLRKTGVDNLEPDRFSFVSRFLEEHVYTVCTEGEPFAGGLAWVEL